MPESAPLNIGREIFSHSVYAELKRIAHQKLTEHRSPTLNTTELVHEAYLKLAGPVAGDFETRAHFFGSASHAMRQVLVDHARRRLAVKRGSESTVMTVTGSHAAVEFEFDELVMLDAALERLQSLSERLARVVEMRFFGGLSEQEIADILKVSTRTVERDWVKARLFLSRELGQQLR